MTTTGDTPMRQPLRVAAAQIEPLADAGTTAGLAVADLDDARLWHQRDSQRMVVDRAAPAPVVVVP
ncbi:hypothetical protein C5N14_17000 [Micromonospora sp. MW-13]|uniref:hypothetical protein n=1 Tax=Micromonospora sp. MW-13 TaxID=2094022 RepID=UPI000E44D59A|nr:hypothetical protein [Micromonospora sp. MW-13]RGC67736.1 hypothetical protein C5N14_17000 [Micromonospora sp. MW-13]